MEPNLSTLHKLGGQAAINAESVGSKERNARVEVIDSALGDRPHEGLGLGAEVPPVSVMFRFGLDRAFAKTRTELVRT